MPQLHNIHEKVYFFLISFFFKIWVTAMKNDFLAAAYYWVGSEAEIGGIYVYNGFLHWIDLFKS